LHNYANAFEFFAACSNNLTLDYNIRKLSTVQIYRNFIVYNATVGLAQARPNKASHTSSIVTVAGQMQCPWRRSR